MAIIKTEALVLKSLSYGETSQIVRLYTQDEGKVSLMAKGARRLKSPFRGYLDPLNHLEVIYYDKPTREIQTLTRVTFIRAFLRESRDYTHPMYGLAILEAIDKFTHDVEDNQQVFNLAQRVLARIDEKPDKAANGLAYFLLRLTVIMGYHLNLERCARCQYPLSEAYYNTSDDQLVCAGCHKAGDLYLSPAQQQYLKYLYAPQNKMPGAESITVTPIINLLLAYLGYHTDLAPRLKTLDTLSNMTHFQ